MSDNSFSQRAGGPFDRGLADRLTATEREEYNQGYAAVKVPSARKNWEY